MPCLTTAKGGASKGEGLEAMACARFHCLLTCLVTRLTFLELTLAAIALVSCLNGPQWLKDSLYVPQYPSYSWYFQIRHISQ